MTLEHVMTALNTPLTRTLDAHRFVRIAAGEPVRLCADAGTLWVTIDGEPTDIEVDAGHCREFADHAPMLVSALGGTATVTVTPLVSRSPWRRVAAALGRAPIREARA
jgi:hypothetical protein